MLSLISAPTNLGLRPPEPGAVPGCSKAPEALREAGLYDRLLSRGALDAGVVLPGRYVDDDGTRSPGRVRNEAAIVDHARRLARRIASVRAAERMPLVLGGDCSVLLGAGLALAGSAAGLVHLDGHTDFRHPATAEHPGTGEPCASVAGEDLAAAVGLHWPGIADIDGRGPYFRADRTVHVGCRADDPEAAEAAEVIAAVIDVPAIRHHGPRRAAELATNTAGGSGYWLQMDVDVLDPQWMPAVDSPDPGGIEPDQVLELLATLAPRAVGASLTILDPDLDPDGRCAQLITDIVCVGFAELGAALR